MNCILALKLSRGQRTVNFPLLQWGKFTMYGSSLGEEFLQNRSYILNHLKCWGRDGKSPWLSGGIIRSVKQSVSGKFLLTIQEKEKNIETEFDLSHTSRVLWVRLVYCTALVLPRFASGYTVHFWGSRGCEVHCLLHFWPKYWDFDTSLRQF